MEVRLRRIFRQRIIAEEWRQGANQAWAGEGEDLRRLSSREKWEKMKMRSKQLMTVGRS
jgi:hypothetical protein